MSEAETLTEARRVMTLCNACRYCEGFCAVFPAMELRTAFTDDDLRYLSNLCHDCRGCYYACQYAPPHAFDVNVPRVFAELRLHSYTRFARPRWLGRWLRRPVVGAWLAGALAFVGILAVVGLGPGLRALTVPHVGAGAFYAVVPYSALVGSAGLLLLAVAMAWLAATRAAGWLSRSGGSAGLLRAAIDAARLTYLGGGGEGCPYPEERPSARRRLFHQLVVWGFLLDLAATSVAALYHHVLHREAPYALTSLPVLLGSLGGAGLMVGCLGLLALRRHADRDPAFPAARRLDAQLLWLLLLTVASGFGVLFLRETAALGPSLVLHLTCVGALFLTTPYGKLIHALHRFAALARWAGERARHTAHCDAP
ncbi:MAG: tricarballylate utilization 4Fe-4S protein TcuB [Gemmatimonadota bacterium]